MAPSLPQKKACGRKPNSKKSTPEMRRIWREKYYKRKNAKALSILILIILCISPLSPFLDIITVNAGWANSEKEGFKTLGFSSERGIYDDGEILIPYQTGIPDNNTNLKIYDSSTFEELHDYVIGTDPIPEDYHGTPAIIKFGDYYVVAYGEHSNLGTLKIGYSTDKENWTVYNFPFNGDLDYTYFYLFPWDEDIHLIMREHGRVAPIEDELIWRIWNCTDITDDETWTLENTLINDGTGFAAYAISRVVDDGNGNDRLLLTWGVVNRTSSLYLKELMCAYSDDLVTWYDTEGDSIELPLNRTNSYLTTLDFIVPYARAEAYGSTIWITPHSYETSNSILVVKEIDGDLDTYDFGVLGVGGELFYDPTDDKVTLFMSMNYSGGWGVRRYTFEDSALKLSEIHDTAVGTGVGLIRRIYPEDNWVIATILQGSGNENVNNILIVTDYVETSASLSITNIDADDWVFEGKKRYDFQVTFTDETLSTINQVGIRFTDSINDVHIVWYDRDANTLTTTSPEDGISGWLSSLSQSGSDVIALFQIMFNTPIPDSYSVQADVKIVTDDDDFGWQIPEGDIFSIYNLGGLSTLYRSDVDSTGREPGGDIFEIYAFAWGGNVTATMLFNQLQHWSMDFDFYIEDGEIYAKGPSAEGIDYSDYGYIELGWDIQLDGTWVEDFLVARINITDGVFTATKDWIQYNITWTSQGEYVKNNSLYGLFEGYSIFEGNKDTSGWHWDIWFNRANASTVVGARLNTEYYGMSDSSPWWAIWSSAWKPLRTEVSESTIFVDLKDVNGTIHSAKDVGLVRSWARVHRISEEHYFAYKILNIAGLDFMVARDTMSGIDTPPLRETAVPDVMSGWMGSYLGGIFTAALERLSNALGGFGMNLFSMSIDFIDNVFASLGYPALVATIFGWMSSLFSYVPTLLGYGMTMIGNVFTLINASASDTLTQLTSIITIWAGMYSTVQDFITGVYTPGLNLWNDLGVNSFIKIGGVLYPLWLFLMWGEKGSQAVFDHLNGVLNIASFFLNFILNIGGFFMNLLTALIGAIRG